MLASTGDRCTCIKVKCIYKYFVSTVIRYTSAFSSASDVGVYLAIHYIAEICVTIAEQ